MRLDRARLEHGTPLQAGAIADDAVGADDNIRANLAVLANLGRWVHEHRTNEARAGGQGVGALVGHRFEVQAHPDEVVRRLAHVHPEAREVHGVEVVVVGHRREDLLLDRGRLELDPVQDAALEKVEASVDPVADKDLRLLDEALDPAGLVVLDDAVLARLVDLCDQDGALLAVLLVELNGFRERELADDVAVEDEEVAAIRAENVPGECERAGWTASGTGVGHGRGERHIKPGDKERR